MAKGLTRCNVCGKSTRDRSTNTREQVAKMSGVGTGTVARYDAIMKTESANKKRATWTDFQTAKKVGVGVGTVARYDVIMKK